MKALHVATSARCLRLAVCLWLLLWGRSGHATDMTYIYDDAGRLAAVVDPSGSTALYSYDAVGNLDLIYPYGSATLWGVNFAPRCGPAGTAVTINGTGFNASANQNTVNFNGQAAVVMAATATQIIAVVPAGASTGPITVSLPGGQEWVSATDFAADCGKPAITSLSPTSGAAGDTVTITGTGFVSSPLQNRNRVEFNGKLSRVDSASSTTLVVRVPLSVPPGQVLISVGTALGSVTSTNTFTVN